VFTTTAAVERWQCCIATLILYFWRPGRHSWFIDHEALLAFPSTLTLFALHTVGSSITKILQLSLHHLALLVLRLGYINFAPLQAWCFALGVHPGGRRSQLRSRRVRPESPVAEAAIRCRTVTAVVVYNCPECSIRTTQPTTLACSQEEEARRWEEAAVSPFYSY